MINEIAARYNLLVIEDLERVAIAKFFPSKPLGGYGDSGACFTNDDQLAKSMKELRVHGQEKRYYHNRIGTNGRMDTLQAAILLPKLEIFPDEVELHKKCGKIYKEMLGTSFKTQTLLANSTSVYLTYE